MRLHLRAMSTSLALAFACQPNPRLPSRPTTNAAIEASWLDRSIDPCTDFYQFACGGWQRTAKLPEGAQELMSLQGVFDQNAAHVKAIVDDAMAGEISAPIAHKVGDFYAACMADGSRANGQQELERELAAIELVTDRTSLARALARIHLLQGGIQRWWTGVGALFSFGSDFDLVDGTLVVGELDQGGLGLPAPTFYTDQGDEADALRAAYLAHVAAMLRLSGSPSSDADADATAIVTLETDLARASVSETARRDLATAQHRLTRAELRQLVPSFAWDEYFSALGRPELVDLNLMVPSFYAALDKLLVKLPPRQLRSYLRWQLLNGLGSALPPDLAAEHRRFGSMVGLATPALAQDCLAQLDAALGPAIGLLYQERYFSVEKAERARELVRRVLATFGTRLDQVTWLDAPTRRGAHAKLERVVTKIGGPATARSYDGLSIDRASHLANVIRARAFDATYWLTRVGTRPPPDEWLMNPQTMSAYFDGAHNALVLPAAIFVPPMFHARENVANTYANLGWVAAHELSHGYDSEGRKYDATGAARAWWSSDVEREFERRAECVARHYGSYEVLPGLFVNGEQTMTENIADLAAIRTAFDAYRSVMDASSSIAGFDAEQQFFVAYAQSACTLTSPELLRTQVASDTHPPWRIRVNAPLAATPEFARVFRCRAGAKMAPARACTVW